MNHEPNPRAVMGDNGAPEPTPFEAITAEIGDLYDEAKNWCDGAAIDSQVTHDMVERLHDMLADAGKRAEALRVAEKKPLDDAVAAIQARFNVLIGNTKTAKGKVVTGKEACVALLTPWRTKVAAEKAAIAAAARAEAERVAAEAQAAIRASRGDLEAREAAEALLAESRNAERAASRADKAATTGTGLRTKTAVAISDGAVALDWAYNRHPAAFDALALDLASAAVRGGAKEIPGFLLTEIKVAA